MWESKLIDCDQSNPQILESGSVRSRRRWHQQRILMFKPLQRTLRSFSQISPPINTGRKFFLGGGRGQFSRFVHGFFSVLLPIWYSYRNSNYCDSNSCCSFRLLKAVLAKSNNNLFAIALKSNEKEAKNFEKFLSEISAKAQVGN